MKNAKRHAHPTSAAVARENAQTEPKVIDRETYWEIRFHNELQREYTDRAEAVEAFKKHRECVGVQLVGPVEAWTLVEVYREDRLLEI